jgi:hypothetical protein
MSTQASLQIPSPRIAAPPAAGFVCVALAIAAAAALLAGWTPITFSIVTVFLFAGPHNWLEFRYFLTRLPARWGRLRPFFLLGFAGMFGFTAAFAGLLLLFENEILTGDSAVYLYAGVLSLLTLWIATLVHMRSRQNPRREWGWFWPLAFGLIALAWMAPYYWALGLVYLHPLMAFWLLDRELRRSQPQWRPAFHACLLTVPVLLGLLWWHLAHAPAIPDDSPVAQRIVNHAGAMTLPGVSSHLLVATHTFLEMLHYGVWVLAIPLIGLRTAPWRLQRVPLAHRSPAWRTGVACFLILGLGVVLALWACFVANYAVTRDLYFTVAFFHVLAEVPFLLRAL